MTNIILDKVQFKRGTKVNMPVMDSGEPYFAYDTKEFFVGSSSGNILVASYNGSKTTVTDSTTNGYIVVDGVQLQVYDDSTLQTALSNKVDKVTGKQLSTEDYTTEDKQKLANTVMSVNNTTPDANGNVSIPISSGTSGDTVVDSTTNGNILVNGTELQVYDDSSVIKTINNTSPTNGNVDISIPTKISDLQNDSGFTTNTGDMQKSIYDTNNSSIVDDSEKLGGQTPDYYAQSTEIGINAYTVTPTFDTNGNLTQVEESDGTNVKKRTTITYNTDGTVDTVTDAYVGRTVVSTLNYTSGKFTSVSKSLTVGGL